MEYLPTFTINSYKFMINVGKSTISHGSVMGMPKDFPNRQGHRNTELRYDWMSTASPSQWASAS